MNHEQLEAVAQASRLKLMDALFALPLPAETRKDVMLLAVEALIDQAKYMGQYGLNAAEQARRIANG